MFQNADRQKIIFTAMMISVYVIAWVIQSHFLLNWDVSWDIRITKRMLLGGAYAKDFIDTNPPLSLLSYSPAVLLAKLFSIKMYTALRLYVFLLSSLSLYFCSTFTKKIFSSQDRLLEYLLLTFIAIVFLILPLIDLGEREHLMVIFTLPYFFAVTCSLQGVPINPYYRAVIGLFAFLGFAMKPYFLLTPALIELYYMFHTRKLFSWVRVEVISILVFLLLYVGTIYLFYPEYAKTVVPLWVMFYYSGFSDPWEMVVMEPVILFCLFAFLFHFVQAGKNPYKILTTVLLVAGLGFIFAYFTQRSSWRYHYLPAYSVAVLMFVILFYSFKLTMRKTIFNKMLIGSLLAGALVFPVYYLQFVYHYALRYTSNQEKLINFLQTNAANKSVYFLSASPSEIFPAVDYTSANYDSRFQHLFWLPGLKKQELIAKDGKLAQDKKIGEATLVGMVNEDLIKIKPEYIFVDVKDYKSFFRLIQFDYLAYFNASPKFHSIWKKYRYVTTLETKYFDTLDTQRWKLYLCTTNQKISPESTEGYAVILTGKGKAKVAYFAVNSHYLTDKHYIFTRPINLSEQEQKFILAQSSGQIVRTKANKALVDSIINQAIIVSAYKYQVYKRIA